MADMNINIINPTINLISQISTTSNSCENKIRFKIQTTNQAQITVAIDINKYTETETDRKFSFIQNGIITKSNTVNHSAYPTYFPNTSNDTFEIVEITLTGNIAEVEFFLENSGVSNNFRAANVLVKDHTNGEDDTRQFLRFNDSSVCSKTGWRPIDPYCKQMNGENTGFKAWNTLEEYNLKTGVATGNTKPNTKNDNDYKSEVYDTTDCPLPTSSSWVAVGLINNSNQNMIKSNDGVNWTYHRIPELYDVFFLNYLDGKWFVIGRSVPERETDSPQKVMYSEDTINWTEVQIPIDRVNCIEYKNGMWISTGSPLDTLPNYLATSTDGINWTGRGGSDVFDMNWLGVEYGNGTWIGYGENDLSEDGTLAYSTDGINWTNGIFNYSEGAPSYGYDAYYNGDYWLCTGWKFFDSARIIGKSTDGINWTGYSVGNTVNDTGRILTYYKNKWILGGVGTNQIAYSQTGETWNTGLDSDLHEIRGFAFDNNKILAVGGKLNYDNINDKGEIYIANEGTTDWVKQSTVTIALYSIHRKN